MNISVANYGLIYYLANRYSLQCGVWRLGGSLKCSFPKNAVCRLTFKLEFDVI